MSNERSVLWRLEKQGTHAPRVALRGSERDPNADERYTILGEIARGGVGQVHKGRDNDLGREVALKVLLDEHAREPELVQRFVEEAQIGGQLQHPGIVPVYELGLRDGNRPFFAMKLVKGETLAARLAQRRDPSEQRRELLAVFREVCRTMAYAHARGVIHRDLKPSNVMIGNFGEVQVVDWGFAKVLRKGGVADEELARKARRDTTMIATVRSGAGSASVAGSVMGTPAYMPPEQALGRVDDLDERSDIFSLGAILCEILTGAPPYSAQSGADRLQAAEQAELDPVYARLDRCGAAGKLVELCKSCLQPLRIDRPKSAQVLGDEVAAYLTSAEGRAHRARIRALTAESRAKEQQRARRFTTLLGATIVTSLLIATAAFLAIDASRTSRARERRAAIDAALQDASRLAAAKDWEAAKAAARRATSLGYHGPLARDIESRSSAETLGAERLEQQRLMLERFDRARGMGVDHFPYEAVEAAFAAAAPDGIDIEQLKDSDYAPAIAAALDAWGNARAQAGRDAKQLDAWARAIDPKNNRWRDAIDTGNVELLEAMVRGADLDSLESAMITHIAAVYRGKRRYEAALELLVPAVRLHPGDFWLQLQLASTANDAHEHELAARHGIAALAIRPDSVEARHWAGIFLEARGDFEGAYELWRGALERRPDWFHGYSHLVHALNWLGRKDEAHAFLEEGVRRFPEEAEAHSHLGTFLHQHAEDYEAALASFERAIKLDPTYLDAVSGYGMVLFQLGRVDEAIEHMKTALRKHRQSTVLLTNLGNIYLGGEIRPPIDIDNAIECYRRALIVNPNLVEARVGLANAFGRRRRTVSESVRQLREAVRQKPWSAHAQRSLGLQLSNLGKFAEALPYLKKSSELEPGHREIWRWLTQALQRAEGSDAAYAYLKQRVEADPRLSFVIGNQMSDRLGRHEESIPLLRKALETAADSASRHYALGTTLLRLNRPEEALPHFEKANELEPEDAQQWCNYGWCLRSLGLWAKSFEALEKGHALAQRVAEWNYPSAKWLAEARAMQRLEPKFRQLLAGEEVAVAPQSRLRLAEMLAITSHYRRAVAEYERAFREAPALRFGFTGEIHRAIRAALLAGEPLHDKAVALFREWLDYLHTRLPEDPKTVQEQIQLWKQSAWFSATRRADAHADWKLFWADVDALQSESEGRSGR